MDDGDNYKKNCQKRHKNKGRYKDKSKVIPKTAAAKETKPSLGCNWDRYDGQIVDEAAQSSKTFSLKGEPVARGGLFIAKSDRHLFPTGDGERPQPDEIFRLDVIAIGAAICRVPFYLRVGIDPHVFTEDEIAQMDKEVASMPRQSLCFLKETKTNEEVEIAQMDEEVASMPRQSLCCVKETKTDEEVEPTPVVGDDEETHEAKLTRDLEDWLSDLLH